ncbi:metallopeptidase family protein [Marivita sp. GX14005]|uniref:metallopeptidase family protein n=1 Tax=Marivita sp. GX14005 TaxID=2942276 RepID=UPI002018DD0F|nr:metallopeptidase family protein [Marivita sp. GX14005]MCL3881146.1 metallopeptidase family protein [Marivita sp. GX14005]
MTGPDAQDIAQYAEDALSNLPAPFAEHCRDIVLRVTDWPAEDMLDDLQIDDRLSLTGLYNGIPLPLKSAAAPSPYPDTIWLFVQPILAEWRERRSVTLEELVHHIVVHEVAHHFGWSDDQIAEIDRWWE